MSPLPPLRPNYTACQSVSSMRQTNNWKMVFGVNKIENNDWLETFNITAAEAAPITTTPSWPDTKKCALSYMLCITFSADKYFFFFQRSFELIRDIWHLTLDDMHLIYDLVHHFKLYHLQLQLQFRDCFSALVFFSIFILSYENLICECELAEVNATLRGKKTSVRFSSVQFTAIVKNRNNKKKWYRKISVKNEFWVKCKHYRCSLDEGVNIFIVVFAPQSVACAKKMRRETKKVTEGEECERKREKEKNERTNERTQQWHHTQKSHKNCVVKSSCLDTQ